jgi:uncharacterized protein YjbI with pentapeptide repeats
VDDQQESRWPTRSQFLWAGGITVLALLITVICGYLFGWKWTGLAKQTFWDWLRLLIVPVVLALGGYLFTRSENNRALHIANQRANDDQNLATQRAKTDREIAEQNRQDYVLQEYFRQMGQLLLEKELRNSDERADVRTLARALTLAVLPRLDGLRKGDVLRFLREADLITKDRRILYLDLANFSGTVLHSADRTDPNRSHTVIDYGETRRDVDLSKANLSGANLRGADLSEATMIEANLSGAILRNANLRGAILRDAILRDAILRSADLVGAVLLRADLYGAVLTDAKLRSTNLDGADLTGANLDGADLYYADLRDANLVSANSLKGTNLNHTKISLDKKQLISLTPRFSEDTIMPDGTTFKDWSRREWGGDSPNPSDR